MPTDKIQIAFRVTHAVAKALKAQAAAERRTVNAIITHLIEGYLEEQGATPKARRVRKSVEHERGIL